MSSSSSTVPKKGRGGRGGVPPPSIFPKVVYPVEPGSPLGIEPPAANTIPMSFDKQNSKAAEKKNRHADTKARIVQFLAPPPSHHDPLRVTSVDQLAALTDYDLVDKALQLFTTDNFSGSIGLPDGSTVSMRDCILEFIGNSKVREGREIKKKLNERLGLIKALVDVERFENKQPDDGSEVFVDDDFSSIGLFDDADEIPSAVKRKRLSTLATVTVGAAQERQDKTKRKIKSTNRFGTNVAVKDRQHLYATESRSYQQNRALLMAPAKKTIPEVPTFPVDISSAPKPGIAPLIPNQNSDTGSAAINAEGHSQELAAEIALAMSAAPFAGSIANANAVDTSIVAEHDVSDYGTDRTGSKSSPVIDIQDITNVSGDENSVHTEYSNDIVTIYDGIRSDLFEDLFQTLPTAARYRAPGQHSTGHFGPLLLSELHQPHALDPSTVSALVAHADDGLFLSALYHHLTLEKRADLLYVHWDTLHVFNSVAGIKTWLESLSQADHLLLILLHAAYWVLEPVFTTTFGETKQRFWTAVNTAGHFVNGVFVIQWDVPLASITVESLLVRTVSQWVQYLARHELTVFHIWDVLLEDVVEFATLDSTVHPKYDVLLPVLITFVNFCSDAYRTTANIEFMLQRQATSMASVPLNLTTMDANILLSTYFPGQYDVDNLQATDGLFLLRRAQSFVLTSPTYLQWSSECNHRWAICWLAHICLWKLS
jgi:hypothetical protein